MRKLLFLGILLFSSSLSALDIGDHITLILGDTGEVYAEPTGLGSRTYSSNEITINLGWPMIGLANNSSRMKDNTAEFFHAGIKNTITFDNGKPQDFPLVKWSDYEGAHAYEYNGINTEKVIRQMIKAKTFTIIAYTDNKQIGKITFRNPLN